MSLNTAHADNGVLVHQGEAIVLFAKNVTVEFHGQETPEFKGSKNGRMYLTTHRLIYNADNNTDSMRSFSLPYVSLHDITVEQPIFGANYIKGKVRAQPNGNWLGEAKFKVTFKSGGAIEFGQAMLRLAHMATRGFNDGPPPYTPPEGPWFAAPPPSYTPSPTGYYGWVPPTNAFPDQPPPNSVFMSSNPPPYPGIGSYGAQANQPGGFQPGTGYPAGGYPPSYPGSNAFSGYPNPPAYPGPNQRPFPDYSTPNGGTGGAYGGPGGAYGGPGGAYGGPGGAYGGYPGAGGMTSADAKAAEAAASGFTSDDTQKASAPPAYQEPPPSYQQSTSKKEN